MLYRSIIGVEEVLVGEAAKSQHESLYEAAKIKKEVINSCAKLGEWSVSYCFA
jgi:hypothetical protein